jgi:hypothetical protein
MMAFDKDHDGSLSKSEVTDERLHRLFDRADADKNGTVTKAELTALVEREHADDRDGPPGGGPGFGGPPGFAGPPGGGPGGPPRPGEILPQRLQQVLGLSPEQRTLVDELQKEVDAKLERILTDEQRTQLKSMRQRGPGGFSPPGGYGPPGGGPGRGGPPGAPPPGDAPGPG